MQQNKIKVLALIGKSASGKDSILNFLVGNFKEITHKIIPCTTRPPRDGEEDGESYFFLEPNIFMQSIIKKEMLEYTEFRGWYYGTAVNQLDKNKINIGVFNPAGVRSLLQDCRLDVRIVYIQADDKIRLLRSLNRETSPDCKEICRRFVADEEDFKDLSDIDYVVWNNNQQYISPALIVPSKIADYFNGVR